MAEEEAEMMVEVVNNRNTKSYGGGRKQLAEPHAKQKTKHKGWIDAHNTRLHLETIPRYTQPLSNQVVAQLNGKYAPCMVGFRGNVKVLNLWVLLDI